MPADLGGTLRDGDARGDWDSDTRCRCGGSGTASGGTTSAGSCTPTSSATAGTRCSG